MLALRHRVRSISRHAVIAKKRTPKPTIIAPSYNYRSFRHLQSSTSTSKEVGKAWASSTSQTASSSQAQATSSQLNAPASKGRDDVSLARYPNLRSAGGLLRGLDYAGTLTFALTGSVTAAQSGLDVFGCTMAGVVTAVGGGTIRDAIFLNRKPFWTEETEYIWMGVATALITFFAWPEVLEWQKKKRKTQTDRKAELEYDELDGALDTLDAIGLSSFAIIGAQNGIRAGMPMLVSAICGMATSTFGGLTRDVLCGRPVRIVHSNAEVYAAPALAGATTYLAGHRMGWTPGTRIGLAMAMCIGSRFIAVKQDVKLHTWDIANDNLGVAVRKKPTIKPRQTI